MKEKTWRTHSCVPCRDSSRHLDACNFSASVEKVSTHARARAPLRWILAALIGALSIHAAPLGLLQGTVRDTSQAVIPNSTVSCIQDESGFRFSTISNGSGDYRFQLPEGHYTVVVRRTKFRAASRMGIFVSNHAAQHVDFQLEPAPVSAVLTVTDRPVSRPFDEVDGSTVVDPSTIAGLPRSDRTVTGLLFLAPGTLITPANSGEPGQVSSAGARPNTNLFTVDGIAANNAVSGGGWPSFMPGAKLPALTALGTTHDLALPDDIAELRLEPQSFTPEFGSAPGATIAIHTRSGTNRFHGSLLYSLRPGALEANDWFANRIGLGRHVSRLSDESVSLGGPLRRDRTFFFIAAEKLDLRQAYTWTTTVPSQAARQLAPPSLQSLLNEFPAPNGPNLTFGLSELVGSYVVPSGLAAMNARVDHVFRADTRAFARISTTPSHMESNDRQLNRVRYGNTFATLGFTRSGSTWTQDTRIGYSRTEAQSFSASSSGSSSPTFFSQFPSFAADFSSVSVGGAGSVAIGEDGRGQQDLLQLSHTASLHTPSHEMRFGFEYVQLHPSRTGAQSGVNVSFGSPTDPFFGQAAPVWITYSRSQKSSERLNRLSGFVQDVWRIRPGLSVTIGVRWLWAEPPAAVDSPDLYTVRESGGVIDFQQAVAGQPLWQRRPVVDPTVSLAWRLSDKHDTVLRFSWATFHDGSFGIATDQLNAHPYLSLSLPTGLVLSNSQLEPLGIGYGFAAGLKLPVTTRWNAALQRDWNHRDWISLSYSGLTGHDLLRRETVLEPSFDLGQLSFATNHGASWYHGLSAVYRRSLAPGLQALTSYTWSHSIDLGSADSSLFLIAPGYSALQDRGSSDFDVRHNLNAALSFVVPGGHGRLRRAAGGWNIGAVMQARSGFPVDVLTSETLNGFAVSNYRPDLLASAPLWKAYAPAPGGLRLNPGAFTASSTLPGTLGRNVVSGFGMWQANVSVERPFRLRDSLQLSLRAEAYNVLNHAQFADPVRYLSNPLFGQSTSALNLMMGSGSPASGQAPAFQSGGPRSMQLSLRLNF